MTLINTGDDICVKYERIDIVATIVIWWFVTIVVSELTFRRVN